MGGTRIFAFKTCSGKDWTEVEPMLTRLASRRPSFARNRKFHKIKSVQLGLVNIGSEMSTHSRLALSIRMMAARGLEAEQRQLRRHTHCLFSDNPHEIARYLEPCKYKRCMLVSSTLQTYKEFT